MGYFLLLLLVAVFIFGIFLFFETYLLFHQKSKWFISRYFKEAKPEQLVSIHKQSTWICLALAFLLTSMPICMLVFSLPVKEATAALALFFGLISLLGETVIKRNHGIK